MANDYYYNYNHYYRTSPYNYYNTPYAQLPGQSSYAPPLPLHLCFFLSTLLAFVVMSWYMTYASVFESLFEQLKFVLMLSPLLLLLLVHWMSSDQRRRLAFFLQLPERDSFHQAGGSPWGVALLLVLLMFMISYQSYFHERWFPLLSR